jgi:hypothetical protein
MGFMQGQEWTFDTVASTYDKIRPGYGEELYEMLFNYISITPESHVVEVFKRNHMI